MDIEGTQSVPRHGIAFVPAGVACALTGDTQNTWLVVSAPVETAPDADLDIVDPADVSFEVAGSDSTRSVPTIGRLTARLNAQGMKVNLWRLEPDEFVAYHREGTQEELYIPLDGLGTMRIAGSEYPLGAGAVARVAPELGRSPVNNGSEPRLWLMIGAPPTGGPNEWDPGAEILEWPGSSR